MVIKQKAYNLQCKSVRQCVYIRTTEYLSHYFLELDNDHLQYFLDIVAFSTNSIFGAKVCLGKFSLRFFIDLKILNKILLIVANSCMETSLIMLLYVLSHIFDKNQMLKIYSLITK